MSFPARVVGYLVAGAIAVGLLFYVFGRIDQLLASRDAEITHGSKALLAMHAARVRERVKLAAIEQRLGHAVAGERAAADSLRRLLATGQRVDTVQVLHEIATHDSSAARGCSLVVLACQRRAESAEREAADYHRQLTEQVTVRDHRCGIWLGGGIGTAGKGEAQLGLGDCLALAAAQAACCAVTALRTSADLPGARGGE